MTLTKRTRIALLDEVRGLCVVLMVVYHGLYTLGFYLDSAFCRDAFYFFMPVEPFFAGVFIFLCGLCCTFSRNNWRRGVLLAGVALCVSLVMNLGFPDDPIWFGVLHMLSVCILLYALLHRLLARVPGWLGLVLCALFFMLCAHLPVQYAPGYFGLKGVWTWQVPAAVYNIPWLYPLGLGRIPGTQGDYFPLLPWVFCFFGGSFLGRYAHRLPPVLHRPHLKPLGYIGRHALIIYIVHQPIIYGVGMLAAHLWGKGF